MKLPDRLRDKLKAPLGVLVPDGQANAVTISAHVAGAPCIITVGDKTTEKLIGFGMVPDLQIIDNREKRSSRNPPGLPAGTAEVTCDNPAAEITDQSIGKIRDALSSKTPTRLVVRGEEDLLVIPACIHAPKNSVVLYGQPGEGMVVVRVDDAVRQKTQRLLDLMNQGNDEPVAV